MSSQSRSTIEDGVVLPELILQASLLEVRRVHDWLNDISATTGLVETACARFELALVEVCNNIVTHGYQSDSDGRDESEGGHGRRASDEVGVITLNAVLTSELLVVEVRDWAPPFDPAGLVEPDVDTPTVHGYGLMIVQQLTDGFAIDRVKDSNLWTLRFRVEPEELPREENDSD